MFVMDIAYKKFHVGKMILTIYVSVSRMVFQFDYPLYASDCEQTLK